MYDIKQLTNFCDEIQNKSYILKNISVRTPFEIENQYVYYKILNFPFDNFNNDIVKLGYCCEPQIKIFPIFINNKGFQIGKTQIFEYQLEENNIEGESIEQISSIQLPYYASKKIEPYTTISNCNQNLDLVCKK